MFGLSNASQNHTSRRRRLACAVVVGLLVVASVVWAKAPMKVQAPPSPIGTTVGNWHVFVPGNGSVNTTFSGHTAWIDQTGGLGMHKNGVLNGYFPPGTWLGVHRLDR